MRGTPWTQKELRTLTVMWARGATSEVIAVKLGRSAGATRDKAGRLGLQRRNSTRGRPLPLPAKPIASSWTETNKKPQPENLDEAPRKCLKCGEDFTSYWIGNRICKPCTASSAMQSPSQEFGATYTKRGGAR